MGLLTNQLNHGDHTTQNIMENTTSLSIEPIEEGRFYILIPFGVLLVAILLSLLVYLMASNRRRLLHIYCKKCDGRFTYEDDELDFTLEHDSVVVEDEVDNKDNPLKSLLKGKLEIINRYENYFSTSKLNRTLALFT